MENAESTDEEIDDAQPTPILKHTQKSRKKLAKRPDFKLCFSRSLEPGHSNLSLSRPIGYKPTIPDKFYIKPVHREYDPKQIEKNIEILLGKEPREKYDEPMTENQKYGWYNIQLVKDPNPMVDFKKNTSFMVQFRILEIAEDEKLQLKTVKKKTQNK